MSQQGGAAPLGGPHGPSRGPGQCLSLHHLGCRQRWQKHGTPSCGPRHRRPGISPLPTDALSPRTRSPVPAPGTAVHFRLCDRDSSRRCSRVGSRAWLVSLTRSPRGPSVLSHRADEILSSRRRFDTGRWCELCLRSGQDVAPGAWIDTLSLCWSLRVSVSPFDAKGTHVGKVWRLPPHEQRVSAGPSALCGWSPGSGRSAPVESRAPRLQHWPNGVFTPGERLGIQAR